MNDTFHEEVSPVVHRTLAGIKVFIGLNVMKFVDQKESIQWNTKPGSIPVGQTLLEDVKFDADLDVREGD